MFGGQQRQTQENGPQLPTLPQGYNMYNTAAGNSMFGSGGGAFSTNGGAGMGGMFSPAMFAALIGMGKNTEANHWDKPVGKGLLAGLGPSFNQIKADPKGMGLPTALGVPFLTPWTANDESRKAKPEWSGFFNFGF